MFVFGLNELGYRAVDQLLKSHRKPHSTSHMHVIKFFLSRFRFVCAQVTMGGRSLGRRVPLATHGLKSATQ